MPSLFNKYPRPIPTPIENLRPARETCEQCHWPQKFSGNLDRTFNYFQDDVSNSPYSIRLSIKVGGADPTRGRVGGIHWHMVVGNTVEYIATDAARQKIPWVRITDQQGVVTVFKTKNFTNDISKMRNPQDGLHGLPQPPGASLCSARPGGQPGHGTGPD